MTDLRRDARHGPTAFPATLLAERLAHLRRVGFADEAADRIFEAINLPPKEVIDQRLADLRELGFADPVKMITSSPAILGYAIDNIRGKIADLRELGFADPVKMITSLPAILGLAIDNIRGKIADLRELGFADPVKMITSAPNLLGYSAKRLRQVAGIVAALDDRRDTLVAQLINKRQPIIDAVEAAAPRSWAEVRAVIKNQRKEPA